MIYDNSFLLIKVINLRDESFFEFKIRIIQYLKPVLNSFKKNIKISVFYLFIYLVNTTNGLIL